jgi:hypothetical protein
MGRTVPSFRMLLEGIIEDLSVFRRCDSRGVGVISARLVIFHLSDIHIH